ncbi:MAG: hypothetical protein ACI9CD_000932 [Candidatus Deianiraeaceae bacterium]|jgi:hypothetical protein
MSKSVKRADDKTKITFDYGIFFNDRVRLYDIFKSNILKYNTVDTTHSAIAICVDCDDQKLAWKKGKLTITIDHTTLNPKKEQKLMGSIREDLQDFIKKEEKIGCLGC